MSGAWTTYSLAHFAPEGGWKPQTYYVVLVQFRPTNSPHRSIFYSGFLNGNDGGPGGYSGLFNPTYDPPFMTSPRLSSMQVLHEIAEMQKAPQP